MPLSTITINGREIQVEGGTTILEAARKLNIHIPTLCYLDKSCIEFESHVASCRICVVEVEGRRNLAPACATPVTDGMVVRTNTNRVIRARRTVLQFLLSDHPFECLTCAKNLDCELQKLAHDFGIETMTCQGAKSEYEIDVSSHSIRRDLDKCIMCRRCEGACNEMQTVGVLSGYGRGFEAVVAPAEMKPLAESNCTFCGQCVMACPTGALTEISYIQKVWRALNNPKKTVICQTAPAVRVGLGEEFGLEAGTPITGKMVAGLRKLGFAGVFDTDFAADLTIVEEAHELMGRLETNEKLPILTSCCPGWVNFLEFQFPDLLHIPSSCKSPQQMFGAVAKTYYAQKLGIDPKDLIVVSIMPCLAKKYEAARPEFSRDGVRDVDFVISTRELVKMFREVGVNPAELADEEFDHPLGESTGAGVIFGASGGVLEAALRTAAEKVSGRPGKAIQFNQVRGMIGIKEATVDLGGTTLRVAVTSGLGNARKILERIRAGEVTYHAIEIMACPGGCINGGGQPYLKGRRGILAKRMEGLYTEDEKKAIRKSHENPAVLKLYEEFLGEPGSDKAHALLHTHYDPRSE